MVTIVIGNIQCKFLSRKIFFYFVGKKGSKENELFGLFNGISTPLAKVGSFANISL